jgi:hypothetical protein
MRKTLRSLSWGRKVRTFISYIQEFNGYSEAKRDNDSVDALHL